MTKYARCCCLVLLAAAFPGGSLHAEPNLHAVFPFGCGRGESVEVTLVGDNLETVLAVHFSREGLHAEPMKKNRWRFEADSEAALGDCDLWIATAEGVAGPRRFSVLPNPVTREEDQGNDPAQAQPVPFPAVIDARLDKAAELDWFSFDITSPQDVTIVARSSSLDGSVQTAFTLFTPDGRELAHSPAHELEPAMTVALPAAGRYRLLLQERAFRRDDFSFYRVWLEDHARELTHPTHLALPVPDRTGAALDEVDNSAAAPQQIALPCQVSGRFGERNEVDWYRFPAAKDAVIHIAAFGERLGQLMDLDLAIHDAKGKLLKEVTDVSQPKNLPAALPWGSLDPEIAWKSPAEGEYLLAIRDLYGSSVLGPDRRYKLVVAVQQPGLLAVIMPSHDTPARGTLLKRGGHAELVVTIVRTGGFQGPVTIRGEGLAAGLALEPCVIKEKAVTQPLKLTANQDAATGFHSLRLVAESVIDSDKQSFPVRHAALVRPEVTRQIDESVVYVSE